MAVIVELSTDTILVLLNGSLPAPSLTAVYTIVYVPIVSSGILEELSLNEFASSGYAGSVSNTLAPSSV